MLAEKRVATGSQSAEETQKSNPMADKHHNRRKRQNLITCQKATSLITGYVNGNPTSKLNRSFEEHLGACPDCLAFLNTYKKTLEFARSFLSDLSEGLPAARLERIQSCVVRKVTKTNSGD